MEGGKFFLPIGIDDYKHPWPILTNAKEDVGRLSKILCEKYGFNILDQNVFDEMATRELIHEEFNKAAKFCYEIDELIIYFAGHGEESPTGTGHWIPSDGDEKRHHWIANSAIIDHIKEIKAKHVFLISDSCYSGTFVLKQLKLSGINLKIEELSVKRSRIILTSGDVTKVSDGAAGTGSPFNKSLCEVLQNNTFPELRLSKLIDSVVRTTAVRSKQMPQACEVDCEDNEGGDMILRLSDDGLGTATDLPTYPLPALIDRDKLIPRTYISSEIKDSIAELLFDLKNGKLDLKTILEQEKHVVLLGSAGSGKSVEALRQAYDLQSSGIFIPVFKRLNDYAGGSIKKFLNLDLESVDSSRVVAFLDGMDEIPTQFLQEATEELHIFSKEEPLLHLVVTCRTNFYELPNQSSEGSLQGFACYHINDITINDIFRFCQDVLKIDGEDFLKQVNENLFSDLLTRPFFLNILLNHFMEHGNLSINRIELLENEIARSLIYGDVNSDEQQKQKDCVFSRLEKIAFGMEITGKNFLTDKELNEIFPEKIDLEFLKQTSIFSLNTDNGYWSFNHNNQQEYFAARVLARLSFDKLLQTTTLTVGGKSGLRPTWINTISFFVSIAPKENVDYLLNWLIENEPEVIVRFEPERLTEELQTSVFKNIFDFYNDKGIWLSSNKFSTEDLSRFANTTEGLQHLLAKLSDQNSSKVAVYNALHVLINFDLSKVPGHEDKIIEILVERIEKFDTDDPSLIHSLVGVLSHLKLASGEVLANLIGRFRKSKNQYYRSALYKLLYNSETAGEHLDVLLDGLDIERLEEGTDERDDVSLGDESFNLRHAIESIKDPEMLQQFLEKITADNFKRWKLTHDHRELYPKLVENAIEGFSKNGNLFDSMINLLLAQNQDHNKHILTDLAKFFISTGTKRDVVIYLWKKADRKDYGWSDLVKTFLDQETVEMVVSLYQSNDFDKDDLKALHELLYRNDVAYPGLLELFESMLKEKASLELVRPEASKWPEIERLRNDENFDKLFSKEKIIDDVKKAFTQIGSEKITKEQVTNLWTTNYYDDQDKWISQVAINVIRENINFLGSTTQNDVLEWLNSSPEFPHFQIRQIHRYLQQDSKLSLNEEQLEFVRNWCLEVADDPSLLWYFFTVSKISIEENQLLELTKFVNHNRDTKVTAPGSIETIAEHISKDKLVNQILTNLADPQLPSSSWSNNAAYSIRNEIYEAYPLIQDRLVSAEKEFAYDKEILEFLFEKTADKEMLRNLILNTKSNELKWKGVKLLLPYQDEHQFLKEDLNKFLARKDVPVADIQEAANFLIQIGDISGFNFLADYILEKQDPRIETRFGYRNFDLLTSAETIGKLYQLLHLAKQPQFKQDIFNDLESRVLAAFVNVGIQSEENAAIVCKALEDFISQYDNEFQNLNFLHYQIARIQEQLKLNASSNLSIGDAMNIYKDL